MVAILSAEVPISLQEKRCIFSWVDQGNAFTKPGLK